MSSPSQESSPSVSSVWRVQANDLLRLINYIALHAHEDRAVYADELQESPTYIAAFCKLRAVSANQNDRVTEQDKIVRSIAIQLIRRICAALCQRDTTGQMLGFVVKINRITAIAGCPHGLFIIRPGKEQRIGSCQQSKRIVGLAHAVDIFCVRAAPRLRCFRSRP